MRGNLAIQKSLLFHCYINNRKGSIAITIVMLVFCLLMSVTMSYHKTIQTETLIQNNTNYSDRAIDAAFSGVNYAMALIQAKKSVFNDDEVEILKTTTLGYESKWISLSDGLENYYDPDRVASHTPPYRFIVSCHKDSYIHASNTFCVKSYGEYLQYEEDEDNENKEVPIATYSAQIIAECLIDKSKKTISLKRYRKMQLQDPDKENTKFYDSIKYDE